MALLLILGSLLFMLIAPRFLARSRNDRVRLAGMIFGSYVVALGIGAAALIIYSSIDTGTAWLVSRRHPAVEFSFAESPVLATLALVVTLMCTAGLVSVGCFIFRVARRGKLGP